MKIEVSNGEIIDKWTILLIKRGNITDRKKSLNVLVEMEELEKPMREIYEATHQNDCLSSVSLGNLQRELQKVNEEIWDVEDGLRELERMEFWKDGDEVEDFIELARQVYHKNDERARLKKEINELTGSKLVEEKSYEEY